MNITACGDTRPLNPRRSLARMLASVLVLSSAGLICGTSWGAGGQENAAAPSTLTAHPDESLAALAAIKADYLYRFLGYVEFPKTVLPQADSPLVIGIMGSDEVFNALGTVLLSRSINNRSVLRRRLSEGDTLSGVHLLFIGKKIDLVQNTLVKAARASSVLLVCETTDALDAGAVFNFLMVDDRLKFEASLEAAERASLKISSRILTLAERVTGER